MCCRTFSRWGCRWGRASPLPPAILHQGFRDSGGMARCESARPRMWLCSRCEKEISSSWTTTKRGGPDIGSCLRLRFWLLVEGGFHETAVCDALDRGIFHSLGTKSDSCEYPQR